MVKHIILWKLRSDMSAEEKQSAAQAIKQGLEGLQGKIPGLVDIRVQIAGRLESSNADLMLDATLASPESLKGYAVHPDHVHVAQTLVRPFTELRTCLDYEYGTI
jgi:type III secretory pathway lipoprotein EscJ